MANSSVDCGGKGDGENGVTSEREEEKKKHHAKTKHDIDVKWKFGAAMDDEPLLMP